MNITQTWQYCLAAAGAALLLTLAVRSAAGKRKRLAQRDFTRRVETVLQPRENIKLVCPQKGGHCVLTSHRLLLEQGENFTAIPLTKIKRVQGFTAEGKATTSPAKMQRLTVKAEKEYTFTRTTEEFTQLAKQLNVRKKPEKKPGGKKTASS